jgi:septal ring factor EnvC (AmiA/AmiB activator)
MSPEILTVKLEALHSDVSDIKSALDRLSDAITKLALVEQQQNQIAAALERAFKAIAKVEDRVSSLEQSVPSQTETAKWVDRGLVALAGAGAVFVGKAVGLV